MEMRVLRPGAVYRCLYTDQSAENGYATALDIVRELAVLYDSLDVGQCTRGHVFAHLHLYICGFDDPFCRPTDLEFEL